MGEGLAFPSQAECLTWTAARFPVDPNSRALKLAEEAGEVCGAVVKIPEGRKTVDDLAMELAQVVLCAMTLAEVFDIDLWDEIRDEWDRVNRVRPPHTEGKGQVNG